MKLVERSLPLRIDNETRAVALSWRIDQDDALHLVLAATPVEIIERDVVRPVEVTETGARGSSSRIEDRSTEHERWERPWEGEVRVEADGQVLARDRVEEGVAHLDLRMEKWTPRATLHAGGTTAEVDLAATTWAAAWIGRRIQESLGKGDLAAARKARALARGTAAATPVEQAWCRAALGPARLAAARDDVGLFVDLLAEVGSEGACRDLRAQAGEVAETQAGLAYSAGDPETAAGWATALVAAGEEDRAARIRAALAR